jgi:hypothetical protein
MSVLNSNSNNGLITKIWGVPGWEFLHCVTFGFPTDPSYQDKVNYLSFFTTIGFVLPCIHCRNSYQVFIKEGDTLLDINVVDSRESITKWLYKLHNRVNCKLDVDYNVSYEEICERYELFRAKTCENGTCTVDSNKGKVPYLIAQCKDAPCIPLDLSVKFIDYAQKIKLDPVYFNFIQLVQRIGYDKAKSNKVLWNDRNKACVDHIRSMRIDGIRSVENNLPSKKELILILLLSSNLPIKKLIELSDIVNNVKHTI